MATQVKRKAVKKAPVKKPVKTVARKRVKSAVKQQPIVINTAEGAKKSFIERYLIEILIIAGLFIFFFFSDPLGCNHPVKPKRDTTTTTNTVYVPQPPVYVKEYVPVPSSSQAPIILPPQYQNLPTDTAGLKALIADLAKKYYTTNTFNDSIQLKDSSGNRVGIVNLEDQISENVFKLRKPSYTLNFPHTTTTNTITVTNPPKFQVLVGGGVTGNQKNFVNGGYLGFGFRNKREQVYLLNLGAERSDGTFIPSASVATYLPIKLGKK